MLRSIALVCALALVLGGCTGPSSDEIREAATGAEASRDRSATAKAADAQLVALKDSMPWLDWRESSLQQSCAYTGDKHVFDKSNGFVTCTTSATQYAVFDMELTDEIMRFDGAVTQAGWTAIGDGPQMPINYYRKYRGRPEGPRTYDAGNLPGVAYGRYDETTPQ